jgi:hypothetical protein
VQMMCSDGLKWEEFFSFIVKHVALLVLYCIVKWKGSSWGGGGDLTALF